LKTYVNVSTVSNKQKNAKNTYFLFASWKPLKKIPGSGSGAVNQRYRYANPGPYQNVTDTEHRFKTKTTNWQSPFKSVQKTAEKKLPLTSARW
jgi:hypothetical protein